MIEEYFSKTEYLPVQPFLRVKLRTIIESNEGQETRRAAIEEAACAFPVFAFNLLKLVNSPVFNLKTKVVTLKQAVMLPTFDKLSELVASMPEYPAGHEERFSLGRFEEHGRAAAVVVQLLATLGKRFSTIDRERLYTAALIHDIGRIFLVMSDLDGYVRLLGQHDETSSVISAEKKYFATDHATLGALALEMMGINEEPIQSAVRLHHEVPTGQAVLVAYADRLVKRFAIGPSGGFSPLGSAESGHDEARLRVAMEEAIYMTIGEIHMQVLSEVDAVLSSGLVQFKALAGKV